MSNLGQSLSKWWENIQGYLFPLLEEELDPLTQKQKQLITILEVVRIENFIPDTWLRGRPPESRKAISRAFIAKSVYNLPTTTMLLEQLVVDKNLRRICGWECKNQVPSEATFSRAFAEFSNTQLPQRVHEALIKEFGKEGIVMHVSSDSTAIEAREKAQKKEKQPQEDKKEILEAKKRDRLKKGEMKPIESKEMKRLEKQPSMGIDEILEDLPKACNFGCKKNSQGNTETWKGYKFHISSADGGIPISAILTSASLHDSQAIIPLMKINATRVTSLYDLCDAAYDDPNIKNYSQSLNHIPLIDINPRRDAELKKL